MSNPPMSVPRTSWETLVWLCTSNTTMSGPAPASAAIGRCQRSPAPTNRPSPAIDASSRVSSPRTGARRGRTLLHARRRQSTRQSRQATYRIAPPARNPYSRLMLSIETPSHSVNSGASARYSGG